VRERFPPPTPRGPWHTPAPAPRPRSGRPAADDALDELEFHWGSTYHLAVTDGVCTAWRRDGKGRMLTSPVPEGLRLLIVADYAAMPVPRDLP